MVTDGAAWSPQHPDLAQGRGPSQGAASWRRSLLEQGWGQHMATMLPPSTHAPTAPPTWLFFLGVKEDISPFLED